MAVEAARLANRSFAGVDILIDAEERSYLLEVNAPHDFVHTQRATGVTGL